MYTRCPPPPTETPMRITLTKAEYNVVNDLRGMPTDAHMMVMCSQMLPDGGGVLDGTEEAFDELFHHINEDLSEGLARKRSVRALMSVCLKIYPDRADWLGM